MDLAERDREARDIAGLTGESGPGEAADAVWLALDLHEAVAGIKEDLDLPLGASIGIIRGIASGARDPQRANSGSLQATIRRDVPRGHLDERRSAHADVGWQGILIASSAATSEWPDALQTLEVKAPPGIELPHLTMDSYDARAEASSREERKEAPGPRRRGSLWDASLEKATSSTPQNTYGQAVGGGARGQVTFRAVVGELGIGKTALLAAFATWSCRRTPGSFASSALPSGRSFR